MIKLIRTTAFPIVVLAALTACGGGGGGGGSTIREVPFSSFQAVEPNQRVVMNAISETVSGSIDVFNRFSVGPSFLDEANSSLSLTYDSSRRLSAMGIGTPGTSLALGQASCSSGVCTAENGTAAIIAVDATDPLFGWNYQSYGVWLNETGGTTFQAGAISAGAITPGTAVPLGGLANFNGLTSAFYVDATGVPFFTSAVMSAAVDFGNQSIVFTSTATQAGNLLTGSIGARPDLDLSGNLGYTQGINRITGTLSTTTNPSFLSGPATGRFYGPAAQEIGGTYNLSGTGGQMLGAFGGKR